VGKEHKLANSSVGNSLLVQAN